MPRFLVVFWLWLIFLKLYRLQFLKLILKELTKIGKIGLIETGIRRDFGSISCSIQVWVGDDWHDCRLDNPTLKSVILTNGCYGNISVKILFLARFLAILACEI